MYFPLYTLLSTFLLASLVSADNSGWYTYLYKTLDCTGPFVNISGPYSPPTATVTINDTYSNWSARGFASFTGAYCNVVYYDNVTLLNQGNVGECLRFGCGVGLKNIGSSCYR